MHGLVIYTKLVWGSRIWARCSETARGQEIGAMHRINFSLSQVIPCLLHTKGTKVKSILYSISHVLCQNTLTQHFSTKHGHIFRISMTKTFLVFTDN